jgi:hypothetical protein
MRAVIDIFTKWIVKECMRSQYRYSARDAVITWGSYGILHIVVGTKHARYDTSV